jgi:hypothetical protein
VPAPFYRAAMHTVSKPRARLALTSRCCRFKLTLEHLTSPTLEHLKSLADGWIRQQLRVGATIYKFQVFNKYEPALPPFRSVQCSWSSSAKHVMVSFFKQKKLRFGMKLIYRTCHASTVTVLNSCEHACGPAKPKFNELSTDRRRDAQIRIPSCARS